MSLDHLQRMLTRSGVSRPCRAATGAQHPTVCFVLAAFLTFGCACSASAASARPLWEMTPYRVQVYLALDDVPRLTPQLASDLQLFVANQIEQIIGVSWNAKVELAPAALARSMLRGLPDLQTENLPTDSLALDKVILVCLRASAFGYRLQGRELDCRTHGWGTTVEREVMHAALLPDATFDCARAAFAPLAEIEKVDSKQVALRLRAGGLPARDPQALPVTPGVLFRPVIRFNDRDGNLRTDRPPQRIPWTYLLAREVNGAEATCDLLSGLNSPLSARRRGRTEQLALAVRPPQLPTRLIVHSRVDKKRKLFGYEVYAYGPDTPETILLGRTDMHGAIIVPPADNPLRILVIKSGGEFLARLPILPGVESEALAAVVNDDDRLAVEGYINGLQEEVVDLVARRTTLIAMIRARIDAGEPEEAQKLLEELRKLRDSKEFEVELNEQRRKHFSSDAVVRRKVDKLFDDTRKVIARNLDPTLIEQVSGEVNSALKAKPAATSSAAARAAP